MEEVKQRYPKSKYCMHTFICINIDTYIHMCVVCVCVYAALAGRYQMYLHYDSSLYSTTGECKHMLAYVESSIDKINLFRTIFGQNPLNNTIFISIIFWKNLKYFKSIFVLRNLKIIKILFDSLVFYN